MRAANASTALLVRTLDEDARLGLGTRVANQHAAFRPSFRSTSETTRCTEGSCSMGALRLTEKLRSDCGTRVMMPPAISETGRPSRTIGGQDLQRGQDPVAGRGVIEEDDVPGLLAAEVVSARAHLVDDIPVADRRADHPPSCSADRAVEPEVAHHGRDEGIVPQRPLPEHPRRAKRHHGVAVDNRPPLVYQDHAVRVPVEADADVSPGLDDLVRRDLRVERSAAQVDVAAVGRGPDRFDLRAELAEDERRGLVRGAVSAVHDHPDAVERQVPRERVLELDDVSAQGVVNPERPADAAPKREPAESVITASI